jgi:hypothetical protein
VFSDCPSVFERSTVFKPYPNTFLEGRLWRAEEEKQSHASYVE